MKEKKEKPIKVTLDGCIFKCVKKSDSPTVLSIVCSRGGYPYVLQFFDDEREKNPFKAFKKAYDGGQIKSGTALNFDAYLMHYKKNVISDENWKLLSDQKNPTEVILDSFKIVSWDYAIPYELHEKIKKEVQKEMGPKGKGKPKAAIQPITSLSEEVA